MAHRAAAELPWRPTGLPASRLTRLVLNPQPDPTVDSSFRLGTVAQTAIGLSGLSAAYFYELRAGVQQDVQIDARHTVLEFKFEGYYTVDGLLPDGELFDLLADTYKIQR